MKSFQNYNIFIFFLLTQGKRCSIYEHLGAFIQKQLQLTTYELSRTRSQVDEMKKKYPYLVEVGAGGPEIDGFLRLIEAGDNHIHQDPYTRQGTEVAQRASDEFASSDKMRV